MKFGQSLDVLHGDLRSPQDSDESILKKPRLCDPEPGDDMQTPSDALSVSPSPKEDPSLNEQVKSQF